MRWSDHINMGSMIPLIDDVDRKVTTLDDGEILDEFGPIPQDLGRSYNTVQERPGLWVCNRKEGIADKAESAYFNVKMVQNQSEFSSLIAWSAKASYGTTGMSASARVQRVKTFKKSHTSVNLVITAYVEAGKFFLASPKALQPAIDKLKEGEKEYADFYGDAVVGAVVMGGALQLVYELDFSTKEETDRFSGNISGSYAGAEGTANFLSETIKKSQARSISLQGFCRGTKDIPDLFASDGADRVTQKVEAADDVSNQLLSYFTNFGGKVTLDTAVPIALELEHQRHFVEGIGEGIELSEYNQALAVAIDIDSKIQDTIADIEYIRDVAKDWNPNASEAEITQRLSALEIQQNEIISAIAEITALKHTILPLQLEDVDPLPRNWFAHDLKLHKEHVFSTHNSGLNCDIELPVLHADQKIRLKYHIGHGGTGKRSGYAVIHLFWLNDDGSTETLEQADVLQDRNVDSDKYLDPGNRKSLHLRGATYENGPTAVDIKLFV